MLDQINQLFHDFTTFTKANPVIAGVVSLWGLGVVTFLFRSVPQRIFRFWRRQLTTSLTLNSQDVIYYKALDWISANHMHKFVRSLNVHGGVRGYWRNPFGQHKDLSLGYGSTFFRFKNRFFLIRRVEKEANQTDFVKEQITLTVLGRNHSIFQDFINEVTKKKEENAKYIEIYYFNDGWELLCKQYKRPIDSIVIDKDMKKSLLSFIDNFNSSKDWYVNNGIPYRTGILLTGPSGTGKTSLIKGLCSLYDKNLYVINSLNSMTNRSFEEALSSVPEGSIVVIEDIDGYGLSLSREDAVGHKIGKVKNSKNNEEKLGLLTLSLSSILNAIDGVASSENRILIATTNYPERLDQALVRDGRFDLKLRLGYVTEEMFVEYLSKFFPDFVFPEEFTMKPKVAMCEVQKLILENRNNPEAVFDSVTESEGGTND